MISPNLPLIDLHHHLDGSVRLETILELGQQHNLPLPADNLEDLRPYVQVVKLQPGVMAFIEKFEWMVGVLVDQDACQRIAYENIVDAKSEGIHYIELRFSPMFMSQPHQRIPEAVTEAIIDGVRQGIEETGIRANLIGILSRHYGPKLAMQELDSLLLHRDHLVALDLAGDEANFPGELFVEHFKIARDKGWQITVHAGEGVGPESIWQAINGLEAQRIGHAARLLEDPSLMEELLKREIGIEANITSNVQTSTVPSFEAHPLKQMLEFGLLATINTDDPGISNIDLPNEYNVAAPAAGLSEAQIHQAQANALELAFLSAQEKEELLAAAQASSQRSP
jgi:adenosine deaminase